MTNELTREKLLALDLCREAREWLESQPDASIAELWQQCERGDWMMWVLERSPGFTRRLAVELGCAIVRRTLFRDGHAVLGLLADERIRNALEVGEAWLRGEATYKKLRAAQASAYAAYVDYLAAFSHTTDTASYFAVYTVIDAARAAQVNIIHEFVPDVQALWSEQS